MAKPRTRARSQVRIPNDWDGETWIPVLFCIPDSVLWKSAVYGAISTLGRGRLWDADTGTVTEAQEIGNEILESVSMECSDVFDGIRQAIEDIAISPQCCPSTVTDTPPVDVAPNEEDLDLTGPVPPGFGSWEDVFDSKCLLAQKYHFDMLRTIQEIENYGGLTTGTMGIAVTAVTALISLPWTIAVGSVAALTFLLTDFSLRVARQEFELLQPDWVCAISASTTTTVAIAELHAVIDDQISNPTARTLIKSWITYNWINQIWDGSRQNEDLSAFDIDACNGCPPVGSCNLFFNDQIGDGQGIATGSLTVDGTVRTITASVASNGFYYIDIKTEGTCPCGSSIVEFEVISTTLNAGEGAGYGVSSQATNCDFITVIASSGDQNPMPIGTYEGIGFLQVGDVPFSMDLRLTAVP